MCVMAERITLVEADQAPLLMRHLFAGGDRGVIVRALATVPELAEVALPFLGAALGPGSVAPEVKETVVVRTSVVLGCRYCVDARTVVALDLGLGAALVVALREAAPGERPLGLDDDTAALVAWIDAVSTARGSLPDEVHAPLADRYAEHQIVELLVALGATMLLNRFCTALSLPSSPETLARLAAEGLAP